MKTQKPYIFDIRRFSLDDGQGIRTTVFLKGCPLSCIWCHNPESMSIETDIIYYNNRCIGCGSCTSVCPNHAVVFNGERRIVHASCTKCGRCTDICPARALKKTGRYYSPDELLDILEKDRLFYETSCGGVTFSGGEPALYMHYVAMIAGSLKARGVHVALQTSGMFDLAGFKRVLLPCLDTVYYDIKLINRNAHIRYTGCSNETILRNFIDLCALKTVEIVPTVPLIPGITATTENLKKIGTLLTSAGCTAFKVRPYNPEGLSKRRITGQKQPVGLPTKPMDLKTEKMCEKILQTALSVNQKISYA
jgi:pyruvate formate lyase activating enzyme